MRHRLVLILAAICYYSGITRMFYRLNRRAKRIITFHNVIPSDLLPNGKRIGLTDSEEEFRYKIKEIKRFFRINNDLFDVCKGGATVSFDDGYKNQSEIAGNILHQEGPLPAVIFVAGQLIGSDDISNALIVDLLLHWVHLVPAGMYKIDNLSFELTDSNRQEIWQSYIWPEFNRDVDKKGSGLLSKLDKAYPLKMALAQCDKEYLRLRLTGIDSNDISERISNGWMIGWHTFSHYPLSKLPTVEKIREIDSLSPSNMKNTVFSYPYGEYDSVDEESREIAKKAGFPCAVSNVCGDSYGKYFLPRLMLLDSNKYLIHFELSGLKYFMTKHRLLPVCE